MAGITSGGRKHAGGRNLNGRNIRAGMQVAGMQVSGKVHPRKQHAEKHFRIEIGGPKLKKQGGNLDYPLASISFFECSV
jgi:hypothetical protein